MKNKVIPGLLLSLLLSVTLLSSCDNKNMIESNPYYDVNKPEWVANVVYDMLDGKYVDNSGLVLLYVVHYDDVPYYYFMDTLSSYSFSSRIFTMQGKEILYPSELYTSIFFDGVRLDGKSTAYSSEGVKELE